MRVAALTATAEGDGPDAGQAALDLEEFQGELRSKRTAVTELRAFSVTMSQRWKEPKDRVIGHVVWAPPIGFSTAPHGYTEDVCVVKLDKAKFWQNFRGNVLDLGSC